MLKTSSGRGRDGASRARRTARPASFQEMVSPPTPPDRGRWMVGFMKPAKVQRRDLQVVRLGKDADDLVPEVLGVGVEPVAGARGHVGADVEVPVVADVVAGAGEVGAGMDDAADAVGDGCPHDVVGAEAVDAEGLDGVGAVDGAVDDGVHPGARRQHLIVVGDVHDLRFVRWVEQDG